jgi:hypothetical protein
MTRRRRWLGLLFVAAALAAAGGLFALLELVEVEVERGPRGAGRRDPLLAARRLLTALGAPAQAHHRLLPPPAAGHALLVVAPPGTVGPGEAEELLAWVERGGVLVTTPQPTLLRAVGAAVKVEKKKRAIEKAKDREESARVVDVDLGTGRSFRVEVGPTRLVDPEGKAALVAGPRAASVVLRYRRGAGTVTFIADGGPLLNRSIGEHEHASFLWALVTAGGRPGAVRVVWRVPRDSLLALLSERAGAALASGLALLGAWAWRRGRRFGPLLPDLPRSRRSLVEHVRASGDFLFRQGRTEVLVETTRRALQRAAARRHPGWGRLAPAEMGERLARISGLPGPRAAAALGGPPPAAPADFTALIQTLEEMRKAL